MMKTVVVLAVLALTALSAEDASAQSTDSNYRHLKPIESLIGKWKMAGKWEDGKEFVGEERSAWMLGKNFMRSTGWFQNHDGQRVDYHIVTGWDPKQKLIVEQFSSSDGGHSKRVGTVDPKTHVWKCEEKGVDGDGEPFSFDVDIHFIDKNKIVWKGTNFKGQQALPALTFTFTRVKQSAKSESPAYPHLKGLEPFVGKWEAKSTIPDGASSSDKLGKVAGKAVVLSISVRWAPGKCAQIIDVNYQMEGAPQIMGTAIRAWDQNLKQIREHQFTTQKGTWAGTWKKDGATWVYEYKGRNLDGNVGTGKRWITFKGKNEFVLKETNIILSGEPQPNNEWHFKRKK